MHGPEDGFFASGGHSLLGVRLLALIRQRFKVAIPLRQIFEKPILSQMAKAIEAASGGHSAEENEVATIKRRARRSDSSGMERP